MSNPIRRCAAPLSEADVALFESRAGLSLPDEYRAFLLATNGGVPRRNRFSHRNKKGQKRETWVRHFYPLGREGLADLDFTDLESALRCRPAGLPAGLLPAGAAYFLGNEGAVCVACDGPDRGQVFFRPEVEASKPNLYYVAMDWATFLDGMEFEDGKERPWMTALQDGDLPRLRAWMERHHRRWAEDRAYSLDIERAAIEENSWPACVLLMELGFDPSSLFEEALSYHRFDLVRSLLQTGRVSRESIAESLMRGAPYLWYLPPLLHELVEAGADINHEAGTGDTPLHQAVEARSDDGVRFLLAAGADPTVKNDDGRTPRGLARRLEETRLAALLQEGERAWEARPRPAEPDTRDFDLCGVEVSQTGPALSLEGIRAAERDFGLDFTPEYRWLLLRANGAELRPNALPIDEGEEDDEDEADYGPAPDPTLELYPLRKGQGRALVGEEGDEYEGPTVEESRGWYHDGSDIPRGMLPIGSLDEYGCHGSGFLLLGCKGRDRGQLFAFDHSPQRLEMTLPGLFAALRQAADRPKDAGQRLADAVEARDLAAVRAALADDAHPAHTTRDGRDPLTLAALAGFDEALEAMADADLEATFVTALDHERFDLARRLLDRQPGLPKEALREQLGYNPNAMKRIDIVRAIVARGVKLKRPLRGGHTYLHNAAMSGSEEAVRFVLEQGAAVDARDEEGDTPLHCATGAGVVRALLAAGAKVRQANGAGETALHTAVKARDAEAARLLLDAGEDLHAQYEMMPPGMSAEQARREAKRVARMMSGGLGDLLDLGEDAPPPPDTSEPAGEKAAGLIEAMGQMMEGLAERMAGMQGRLEALGRGSWGQGPSAAEAAGEDAAGRALVAELEAHVRGREKKR